MPTELEAIRIGYELKIAQMCKGHLSKLNWKGWAVIGPNGLIENDEDATRENEGGKPAPIGVTSRTRKNTAANDLRNLAWKITKPQKHILRTI